MTGLEAKAPVLQVGRLIPPLADDLRRRYRVEHVDAGSHPRPEPARVESVVACVTGSGGGVTAELIDRLPRLRSIVVVGSGTERTDVDYAHARGIDVRTTAEVLIDCVADLAVGMVIDVMRGMTAADRYVREGRWPTDGAFPLRRKVSGARVGIVGLGRIGSGIATRLMAFGCSIGYHQRRRRDGCDYAYSRTVEELAAWSDVLVVAAAGGPSSAGLVGRRELAALGPDGFLVNVGRGSVLDETALIEALAEGGIGGAALDVYADEPRVPSDLFRLDNVVILPHIGSATVQTRDAMARAALDLLSELGVPGR